MADTTQKIYITCPACPADLPVDTQYQVYMDFENADMENTFVSNVQEQFGNGRAEDIRKVLNSSGFTNAQRSTFNQSRKNQQLALYANADELSNEFFSENRDTKERSRLLEAMSYQQQGDILSTTANNPLAMATLRDAVRGMPAYKQEQFHREALSRASEDVATQYMNQLDLEKLNTPDEQVKRELQKTKESIFPELSASQKVRHWESSAAKTIDSGNDASLVDHQNMVKTLPKEEVGYYHGAFKNTYWKQSPQELATSYSLIPQEARITYLKNPQDTKAAQRVVAVREVAAKKGDKATVEIINTDLRTAGITGAQRAPSPTSAVSSSVPVQPTVRASAPARPATPSAAPSSPVGGQTAMRGGGGEGRKTMNQEAVKAARDASRLETKTTTLPPNIEKVLAQPSINASKAFTTMPLADQRLAMQSRPKAIIDMLDVAPADALPTIVNAIQNSAAANTFRAAPNQINTMTQNDQRVAFEAVASSNNPQELRTLRAAVSVMPEAQRQEFITNVVSQGSRASTQKYLKEVATEKAVAQKAGKAEDVKRLAQEETIVSRAMATNTTQPAKEKIAHAGTTSPTAESVSKITTAPASSTNLSGSLPPPPSPTAKKSVDGIVPSIGASIPQEVGVRATEDVAGSKEEKLDSELAELKNMEEELALDAKIPITESRLTTMLRIIDGKLLLLESLRRSKEETSGDPVKVQALFNIIRRYQALKAKAEAKMQELKSK